MTDKTPSLRALPARPSLDSLRKQAKKLARQAEAGDAEALARARAQLAKWEPPLSLRDAQLVLAREYGFAGWGDLREEVLGRAGEGLERAVLQAERAIHDNDTDRLKALLTEHPALLTWIDEHGHPLLQSTTPYAMDVTDPKREAEFCRPDCAALLIDAGAVVTPSVWEILMLSGAAGMMQLLGEKNVLPRTLPALGALGDLDGVRALLGEAAGGGLAEAEEAFRVACRFRREAVATALLDRCVALDPDLGPAIDRWGDRAAFVAYFIEHCPSMYVAATPWRAFVMNQLESAMHADDEAAFTAWLEGQPWLLGEACLDVQVWLIEQTVVYDREAFLRRLLDHDPAILREPVPPPSPALRYAFDYCAAHLAPLLTRIWPLPDDLPHAAGLGNLAAVKRWFDEDGRPALGDLARHSRNERPGPPTVQQVLDLALGWSCMNDHLEVAEFLLAHGADINTDWATHEPASILHEAVIHRNWKLARFLVDHGVDLTIRDHRWNATAAGWAYHAADDKEMCRFLMEEEERRKKEPE